MTRPSPLTPPLRPHDYTSYSFSSVQLISSKSPIRLAAGRRWSKKTENSSCRWSWPLRSCHLRLELARVAEGKRRSQASPTQRSKPTHTLLGPAFLIHWETHRRRSLVRNSQTPCPSLACLHRSIGIPRFECLCFTAPQMQHFVFFFFFTN